MTVQSDWRKDFPIIENSDIAYLDTASSAQKSLCVIEAFKDLYETEYANIHRGLYRFSQNTTQAYEAVRQKVKDFINAPHVDEVVFTRNTTEAINLVASSWGKNNLQTGDEIILTQMEHHANIVPWQLLAKEIGFIIKVIPVLDDATLDYDALPALLSEKTKFVGLVYISNATGVVNDVKRVIKEAKAFNNDIVTLIDGTQAVVHNSVDVSALGCEFFTFTGHKIYGPNGIGILWGRGALLDEMTPYQGGGDMIETVSFKSSTTFKTAPAKFEAGTPAIAEVIALGVAIDYMTRIGFDAIMSHENELLNCLRDKINNISGLKVLGDVKNKASIVSFTAEWAHTSDIAMILNQCDVAVRTGHHCCMPLMEHFNIDGTIRASLGLYNNKADIDKLVIGLNKAKEMLS